VPFLEEIRRLKMKLKEYADKINAFLEEYPDIDVVYASDEEGNSFHRSYFSPSIGTFENNEFKSMEDQKDKNIKPTVICIN
jgi:hypothetical protein